MSAPYVVASYAKKVAVTATVEHCKLLEQAVATAANVITARISAMAGFPVSMSRIQLAHWNAAGACGDKTYELEFEYNFNL